MKIGIVCYPTLGGSGILATELGHELAARGHTVHFITYEQPFRLRLDTENLFFHEVDLNQYDLIRYPDYALALAVKLHSVAREFDLDVLHVHYAIPHATSAYLARQLLGKSRPVIITTLHGTDITVVGRDPAYFEIVRFSIEHSDGVTAVSHYLRRQTLEYFKIQRPIEVIYNFFTPRSDLGYDVYLRDQHTPNGEKLLIHASNFRPVKRVTDVIRIFAKVRQSIKCKLMLLGTGVGIEDARDTAKDLGVMEDVLFLGKQVNVDVCTATSDVFLLPSSQESFGLAALEAMAYGVPVVASTVGGIPEVVHDGETGFLKPVGDIDGMAARTLEILQDDALAKRLGENGRQRARDHFTVERILPKYEAYYERILAESR